MPKPVTASAICIVMSASVSASGSMLNTVSPKNFTLFCSTIMYMPTATFTPGAGRRSRAAGARFGIVEAQAGDHAVGVAALDHQRRVVVALLDLRLRRELRHALAVAQLIEPRRRALGFFSVRGSMISAPRDSMSSDISSHIAAISAAGRAAPASRCPRRRSAGPRATGAGCRRAGTRCAWDRGAPRGRCRA